MSNFRPDYNELIRAQSDDGVTVLSSLWIPELRRPGERRDALGGLQLPAHLMRYEADGGTVDEFVDRLTEVLVRRAYDQLTKLTGVAPEYNIFQILTPPTQIAHYKSPESAVNDALVRGAQRIEPYTSEHQIRMDFFQMAHSLELLLLRSWYRLPAFPVTGVPALDVALSSISDAMEYYAPSQRFVDEILSRAELLEDVRDLLSYDAEEYLRKTLIKVSLDTAVEYEPLAAELSRRYFASLGRRLTPDQVSDLFNSYGNGA